MSSGDKTRFTMAALAPGVRLNDTYEIDTHIASGGMGEVYRGHNIETGEPVAIKAMLPELARDEAIFALFKKEATLLGRLRHDTIVHYYSFSRDPAIGQPYLAMEFVEGQPLSERIAAGPLGVREAATLFIRIADGLAVAHEAGIVHRDLSPDNIILSGGDVRHPRIIDFGIARSVHGGDKTLVGSNFAGKFAFVSPEQLGMAGGEVTQQSDIYSLALVMAAALSGRALDMGRTNLAVIEKRRVVPDLTGIDAGLVPLLTRMLAPEPADRPADMAEVADWLRAYLAGRPPTIAPTADRPAAALESPFGAGPLPIAPAPGSAAPTVATAAPPGRRFGTALAASVVALLAVAAGGAYLGGLFDGEDKLATTERAPVPVAADAPAGTDAVAPTVADAPQASGTDAPQASDANVVPRETLPAAEPGPAAKAETAAAPDTTAIEPQRPAADEAPAAPGDGAKTAETEQAGRAPADADPAATGPVATLPAGAEPDANVAGATPAEIAPAEAPPTETAATATMQNAVATLFAPQPYTQGTIRPNHHSQEDLDRALVDFYREWKGRYVVQDCGEGRYLLKVNADGKAMEGGGAAPGSITVSEAHGYGMLAVALMAGADPEAQATFDGMHRYRADHPARSSPHLMAWNQVEGCRNAGEEVGGDNTATDGDLDIAYALLLADKAWGSAGAIDYRAAALATIGAILEHEVSASGDFLMLGDWAAASDEKRFRTATRTSDFMLSHIKAFADASGETRWLALRDRSYAIIETITKNYSPKTALMPDFIVEAAKAPKPAPPNFMEGENDGDFSWNAARYPWRVGLDYLLYGETRAQAALTGLNTWVKRKVKDDPARLADTYRLNGTAAPGADTGALTFVSLMGVAAMIDAENQAWLNAVWDHVTAQKLEDDDFYGNTLKLMAMIAMSGHWAKP